MRTSDGLSARLKLSDTDAALIISASAVRYLTGGFTGEGCVLLTGSRRILLTDSRFTLQCQVQCPDFEVALISPHAGMVGLIVRLCREIGINSLRIEEDQMSVMVYRQLKYQLAGQTQLMPLAGYVSTMRAIKDERELHCLSQACTITDAAFAQVLPQLCPGVSERAIAAMLDRAILDFPNAHPAFRTLVASGSHHTAMPHHEPSARELQPGDVVVLDFGAEVLGYRADMTRTVFLGGVSDELKAMYDVVEQALQTTLAALCPGMSAREADRIGRHVIEAAGYGDAFMHALGHGVGLDVHEAPFISAASGETLQPGMVFTIEPGIYVAGVGGVRLEDTVRMESWGCERMTQSPTRLHIC